jgi:hypothetical protein
MATMVKYAKFGKEIDGLEKASFGGQPGEKMCENFSRAASKMLARTREDAHRYPSARPDELERLFWADGSSHHGPRAGTARVTPWSGPPDQLPRPGAGGQGRER